MLTMISRLLAGDQRIPEQFAQARRFWNDFFDEHAGELEPILAESLGKAQSSFYRTVAPNDYAFAKAIMALTAIGSLYDDANGFGEKLDLAQKVVRSFKRSSVSVEVKGAYLRETVALYDLPN